MHLTLGLIALVLVATSAEAQVQLGAIQLGGTACQLSDVGPIPATLDGGKLQIPAAIMLKKEAARPMSRGTCAFSLPVQVDAGYRLVLSDSSTLGLVNLAKGTKARVSVELFKVGAHGQVLSLEESAVDGKIRKNFELKQAGEVLRTECGESTILRGNASVMLQGSARATSSIQLIEMGAVIEACE
jgi:hypothetical protein